MLEIYCGISFPTESEMLNWGHMAIFDIDYHRICIALLDF